MDSKSYINLYKECNTNAYSFLVINTTLSFGNLLRFRKNLLGRIYKIIMSADDKIRDEKLHYYIIREVAKISALISEKIDKFEYLRGETILPPDQRRVKEHAEFTFSPFRKALEKQTKTIKSN